MSIFFGDLETYNEHDIKAGAHKYAETVELDLFAWAVDDDPVQVWDCQLGPMPQALFIALTTADKVVFHNSAFDRTVLRATSPLICPPLTKWFDTMVAAYAHSLPGGLDKLCAIFNLPQDQRKQKEGRALMLKFCKPALRDGKMVRATYKTHPEERVRYRDYAKHDVMAMREIYKRLPTWNNTEAERALWLLDQTINDRGICVDRDLARAAIRASEKAKNELAEETQEMTLGVVDSATKRDQLLTYILAAHGVDLPDLKKSTVERRINDETLPQGLRDLLAVRLEATTTSVSKYKTLIRATNTDGRMRGTMQFCGAGRTGRWAHRQFQPGNMPRPKHSAADIALGIEVLKADGADLVFPSVMGICSSAIRGCITAPEGKHLAIADLSNIEGRAIAWLAGEEWKLQAFRDFDDGTGHDLYALAYAKSFGIRPEAVMENKKNGDGSMRQIGKVMELALGYEGGVGAFVTFALVYGINLDELAKKVLPTVPKAIYSEAMSMWGWAVKKRRTLGLEQDTFVACDCLKRLWREAHPEISGWWKDLGEAARCAIAAPGREFPCRAVTMIRTGAWLRIVLPSGRNLCYPSPRVEEDGGITYLGVNQYSRQWSRLHTYGGKLAENITQAFARDVLGHGMVLAEDLDYRIVCTVHDEIIAEADSGAGWEGLAAAMATVPDWAEGLPLAAAGFDSLRYRKD